MTERLDVQSFDAVHHGAVVIDRKITESIHRQIVHCGKGACKIEKWMKYRHFAEKPNVSYKFKRLLIIQIKLCIHIKLKIE